MRFRYNDLVCLNHNRLIVYESPDSNSSRRQKMLKNNDIKIAQEMVELEFHFLSGQGPSCPSSRLDGCGSLQRSGYNAVLAEEALQCGQRSTTNSLNRRYQVPGPSCQAIVAPPSRGAGSEYRQHQVTTTSPLLAMQLPTGAVPRPATLQRTVHFESPVHVSRK